MSMDTISRVLRLSNPNLSRSAHKLLLILAYHTNHLTGLTCPGHRLLAQELLITERQVIRLVHRLEKDGWIEVVRGQGRGHLSVYRIKLDPTEVIHRKGDILPPAPRRKGDISGQEKVTFQVAPINVVEPKERNQGETFSLSLENGPDGPEQIDTLEPEVQSATPRRIRLTPGSAAYRLLYSNPDTPGGSSDRDQTKDSTVHEKQFTVLETAKKVQEV
jgi:hypothetical protein